LWNDWSLGPAAIYYIDVVGFLGFALLSLPVHAQWVYRITIDAWNQLSNCRTITNISNCFSIENASGSSPFVNSPVASGAMPVAPVPDKA